MTIQKYKKMLDQEVNMMAYMQVCQYPLPPMIYKHLTWVITIGTQLVLNCLHNWYTNWYTINNLSNYNGNSLSWILPTQELKQLLIKNLNNYTNVAAAHQNTYSWQTKVWKKLHDMVFPTTFKLIPVIW